jgi:hypothetical protein
MFTHRPNKLAQGLQAALECRRRPAFEGSFGSPRGFVFPGPAVPNTTPENKTLNRRIEVIIWE